MSELTPAQLARFCQDILRCLWEGYDLEGGEVQDLAEKHGLITCVPFDPDVHEDLLGLCVEPAADWYVEHPDIRRIADSSEPLTNAASSEAHAAQVEEKVPGRDQ